MEFQASTANVYNYLNQDHKRPILSTNFYCTRHFFRKISIISAFQILQLFQESGIKRDVCDPDVLSDYFTLDDDSAKKVANSLCKAEYNKMFIFLIKLSQHLDLDAIFEMVRSKKYFSSKRNDCWAT